jgi:hypothetical protein
MSANVLLISLVLGVGQLPKEVSDADKQAFFKLVPSLELQPAGHAAIFTEKSVRKATPFATVLFALTEKDLENKDFGVFMILTTQLGGVEEARKYGIKNFVNIAHPKIKLFWAHALYAEKVAPPEIVTYLRNALESREARWELNDFYGPGFRAFWESVIRADEINKQPKVELVKKHVKKNRFPAHGGGFDYRSANCVFVPGPLLIAARPLNNDRGGPDTGRQGELFTSNVVKGITSHRLIPPINQPREWALGLFNSPVLSVNARGDLFCFWTIEGNGEHGLGLLKKGADSMLVKRVSGPALSYDSRVVADADGAWYLIQSETGEHCTVWSIDEKLNLTQIGKLVNAECGGSYVGFDARFIAKDVLHLAWPMRCVDFHVKSGKWLHHRELYRGERSDWAGSVTALQLNDDSLHHLWSIDGGKEHAKLTGVYCQAESKPEPFKVSASQHYRAIAVGNRIIVCYTLESSLTTVFFRVIHHGTMGPISEIRVDNKLDYSLWRDSMQVHAEGDRIWFVNTMEPDTVYELRIADRK